MKFFFFLEDVEKATRLHEAPVEHPFLSSLSTHYSETRVPMTALADVSGFTQYSVGAEFCLNYRQAGSSSTLFPNTLCAHYTPNKSPKLQFSSGLICATSVFAKCQETRPVTPLTSLQS